MRIFFWMRAQFVVVMETTGVVGDGVSWCEVSSWAGAFHEQLLFRSLFVSVFFLADGVRPSIAVVWRLA